MIKTTGPPYTSVLWSSTAVMAGRIRARAGADESGAPPRLRRKPAPGEEKKLEPISYETLFLGGILPGMAMRALETGYNKIRIRNRRVLGLEGDSHVGKTYLADRRIQAAIILPDAWLFVPGTAAAPAKLLARRTRDYSAPVYTEWCGRQYVRPRRHQARIDIFRPSVAGKPVSDPSRALDLLSLRRAFKLPRPAHHPDRYGVLARNRPQARLCHRRADVRGDGAYSAFPPVLSGRRKRDAYDMVNGSPPALVTGKSHVRHLLFGMTQLMRERGSPISRHHADMVMFDIYSFAYPGGVFQDDFIAEWSNAVKQLDTIVPAAPVDEDKMEAFGPGAREKKEHLSIDTTAQGSS